MDNQNNNNRNLETKYIYHQTSRQCTKSSVIELFQNSLTCEQNNDLGMHVCTPVFNFNRLLSDANQSEFLGRKKIFKTSWSVYRRFSSVFKIRTVACEGVSSVAVAMAEDGVQRNEQMLAKLNKFRLLDEEVDKFIASETGMDRLRRVFTPDPVTKQLSTELKLIQTVCVQMFTFSFLFGLYKEGISGKDGFMKRNQTTLYATKSMAHKRMYGTILQAGMRGGAKWSLITCSYLIPIMLIQRCLSVYYNRTSPLDLMVACGAVSAVSKINLGGKGMFAGGAIGSVIGLVSGVAIWAIEKSGGITQDQITYKAVKERMERNRSYKPPVHADEDVNTDDVDVD